MSGQAKAQKYFVIIMVFGVLLIPLGVASIMKASASSGWPMTEGKVIESRVTYDSTSKVTDKYQPEVKYKYIVDGEQYISKKLAFGKPMTLGDDYAQRIVSEYPQGTQVTVYYNPKKPQVAVLRPGLTGKTYLPLIMGITCLAGGFIWKNW